MQLPLYSARWCLVAYTDCVFNLDTGVCTPVAEFNARRNGFCAKRFAVPFPSTFQLPRTIGILAKQGYSLYAVMVLFAFLGRLLFPLGRRDEWIQLLFLLGKSQTGKTTLYRLVSEGCMDPRDVRNLPSDPKYPLASLFSPPGARLWSNGDTLMENFLTIVKEEMLLKLIDGTSQAYWRKNMAALEHRNTLPGIVISNRDAASAAGDAGGSMTARIIYWPFFKMVSVHCLCCASAALSVWLVCSHVLVVYTCLHVYGIVQVDDSQKDTQLVAHLIHTEAPVFTVVASSLYRALTVAAAGSHISLWYPRIVKKVLAEVQEGLHGFIRWLNSKTMEVSASCNKPTLLLYGCTLCVLTHCG
jgi:hypothetical protein